MTQTTEAGETTADSTEAPPFVIARDPIPSFAFLEAERGRVHARRKRLESFTREVEALGSSGEEGRRRGLGLWMIGRYEEAEQALADHEQDDVAAFTRATALFALRRFAEAAPIFQRLSDAYPDEPRPREGALESRLEQDLAEGKSDEEAADALEAALDQAPESFRRGAQGHYLDGRVLELRRDWYGAIEQYRAAYEIDATHRSNLFRLALLSERWGDPYLALDCYETLASMPPVTREILMNLGVLYEDLGQDQNAAACYDTVVRADPTDSRARLYLADAKAGMEMYYDEDMERKEDRLNQILRTPITDFELSVRARNCLNKMNIHTLGDLVKKSEAELLSYKNFGETSLNEIKEILHSKGLRLGMAREEAVASIDLHRRRYQGSENADVLNRPITELELSIRARRTVEALGCLTLGDVIQHSDEELLGMPNFGQTSLQELKDKLAQHGLQLKSKQNS